MLATRLPIVETFHAMKPFGIALAATILLIGGPLFAQELSRKELPSGHAPPELLRETIQQNLSAYGKFVLLQQKGKVLVIDFPDKIAEVEKALAALDAPAPEVVMDFAFRNAVNQPPAGGGRALNVLGPVSSTGGFPYPTSWDPPRIVGIPGGGFAVVPAHPRNFVRRNVGVTMETEGFVNPDGSISLNINAEHVEFEGFINYGSAILAPGFSGIVPVLGNAANPVFFGPILTENRILVPIFDTTRIQTQVVVRPQVIGERVRVEMIPQLIVEDAEAGVDETVSLKDYRTSIELNNGGVGVARGFTGASADFNRNFLGEDPAKPGSADIMIRATVQPAGTAAKAEAEAAAAAETGEEKP